MSTFKYVIIRKLECMIIMPTYSVEYIGKYLHIVLKKPPVETRGVDPECFSGFGPTHFFRIWV